ncbi:MAG: flagellar motor switch protein FliN [Phycisphaerae bacterium]
MADSTPQSEQLQETPATAPDDAARADAESVTPEARAAASGAAAPARDDDAADRGLSSATTASAAASELIGAPRADAAVVGEASAEPPATPFAPPDFGASNPGAALAQLELLDDVELHVKVELGRAAMLIEDVLRLGTGSVVELDKLAGDPVDVYVNDRLVARGEVLVLNDSFCVRINDILSPAPELEATK